MGNSVQEAKPPQSLANSVQEARSKWHATSRIRQPVRYPLEANGQAAYSRIHRAHQAKILAIQQLTREVTLTSPPQSLLGTLTPSPGLDHARTSTQEIAKAPSAQTQGAMDPSGATRVGTYAPRFFAVVRPAEHLLTELILAKAESGVQFSRGMLSTSHHSAWRHPKLGRQHPARRPSRVTQDARGSKRKDTEAGTHQPNKQMTHTQPSHFYTFKHSINIDTAEVRAVSRGNRLAHLQDQNLPVFGYTFNQSEYIGIVNVRE